MQDQQTKNRPTIWGFTLQRFLRVDQCYPPTCQENPDNSRNDARVSSINWKTLKAQDVADLALDRLETQYGGWR